MKKLCPACGKEKSIEEFGRNKQRKDGRASSCLLCNRKYTKAHYSKNKGYYYLRNVERKKQARKLIDQIKNSGSCKDCGEKDPCTLDFDHIKGNKKFNISDAKNGTISMEKIKAELKKCELVCANCHRKRTFKRKSSLRSA